MSQKKLDYYKVSVTELGKDIQLPHSNNSRIYSPIKTEPNINIHNNYYNINNYNNNAEYNNDTPLETDSKPFHHHNQYNATNLSELEQIKLKQLLNLNNYKNISNISDLHNYNMINSNINLSNRNSNMKRKDLIMSNIADHQKLRMNNILNDLKLGNTKKEVKKFSSLLNNYYNSITEPTAISNINNINNINNIGFKANKKLGKLVSVINNSRLGGNLQENNELYNNNNIINKVFTENKAFEYEGLNKEELIKLLIERDDLIDYLSFNNDKLKSRIKELSTRLENMEKCLNVNNLISKSAHKVEDYNNEDNEGEVNNKSRLNKSKNSQSYANLPLSELINNNDSNNNYDVDNKDIEKPVNINKESDNIISILKHNSKVNDKYDDSKFSYLCNKI